MAGSRVKRLPVSFKGRLTRIKVNGTIKKQYSYDACTHSALAILWRC